jgi:histidine ammonia-lyase
MMLEYVAAAAAGRIRANSYPSSLQTVVLSLGAEEDASFASEAAAQLASTVQTLPTILAIELICAVRALRLQGHNAEDFTSPRLSRMMAAGIELDGETGDRDLRDDLDLGSEITLRDFAD